MGVDRYVFNEYYIGITGCQDFESYTPNIENILAAEAIAISAGLEMDGLDFIQYAGFIDGQKRIIQMIYVYKSNIYNEMDYSQRCNISLELGAFAERNINKIYVNIETMEIDEYYITCG